MYLIRDDISEITRILEQGGLICYPTDTIWGIGCDATNEAAIARIYALKGRAPQHGYVTLVDSIDMLRQYVTKMHPRIETLLAFHLRPLTIVYDKVANLPEAVRATDGSAAIRVVQDDFCSSIIRAFGRPIVSTAACKHDQPWPPIFGAISSEILGGVDYVVKYRQDDKEPGEPSPVARLDRHQEMEFLRE
jgi:L-threonylcarbamoyladenylate synthase